MDPKSLDPKTLRYSTTHEWASLQGDTCTIGITKFAVEQLGDIVYVELPDAGDHVFKEKDFGEIESVKAVSPLVSPLDGEVIAVNEKLQENPDPLIDDPYGKGWMIRVKLEPGTRLDHLMTLEQYEKQIASEGH
jgi:glycine cleavage system H protein